MKIGTITTHSALNYGAVLQAYALCKFIRSQKINCDILDYQPKYIKKSYSLLTKPKKLQDLFLVLYQLCYYSQRNERKSKFEDFRKSFLNVTSNKILSKNELIDTSNKFDLLISGSDQIWNPKLHEFDEAYFLSYDEIKVPRISYAASFGQDRIEDKYKDVLINRLKGYHAFGCRENSARKLLLDLLNRESVLVLDPVFLLDVEMWKKIAIYPQKNLKYNLAYFLSNPGESLYAVKKYSDSKKESVVSIGFSPRDMKYKGINKKYNIGPREFLGYIIDADTIISNSFHCTAFSIIFRKNFYVRVSAGNESRNDRMVTLLNELGLSDRVFTDKEAQTIDFNVPIDYKNVEAKLTKLTNQSKDYIRKEISEFCTFGEKGQ